jgi:predicted transcriptional regulator
MLAPAALAPGSPGALKNSADLSALLIQQPAVPWKPHQHVLEAFRRQANLNSSPCWTDRASRVASSIAIRCPKPCSSLRLRPVPAKPVSQLMSKDFVAVERGQSLQQVSRLLTSRAQQRIEEAFIITQGGRYLGLGRVIDVLKLITEQQSERARDQSACC